ncbi:MBL fold metallo-hydrolase [Microvirga antarctica]|uniref:MBL fold metallo-hydrolase n=1 Tax=Microvirga antarctica TaxID=2819233 RepID=UPI001B3016BD|nr:MBL fold metallo-hydrolase [Microvirga antarctica]
MTTHVTILGCGSSGGVPRVGGGWGACDPENPRNRRRRCSILVQEKNGGGTTNVLVDTSPDLREQLLEAGTSHLDGVLFTHSHADHVHGIDDLRPLVITMRRKIPVYADRMTSELLLARFGYCFESPAGSGYPPILEAHRLDNGAPTTLSGAGGPITATPFRMVHGDLDAYGFRIGRFAYAPDVSEMPAHSVEMLRDLDILVLDALRYTPHPTHFSVEEALDLIADVKPRRAILTNLHTDLDFETLRAQLPANVEPAYDGLQFATI